MCLRSSDTIQPRRPCYKTRYPGRVGTNAEFLSFSSKYFYVCDVAANTVSLYQCGDERVLGDVAGTDCSSTSGCALRQTFTPNQWTLGHHLVDKNVWWDGRYYSIDFWLRRERWITIGKSTTACAAEGGREFHTPNTQVCTPSGDACVPLDRDGDIGTSYKSMRVDCGAPADPLATPRIFAHLSTDCSDADPKIIERGLNNTCGSGSPYQRGPRYMCAKNSLTGSGSGDYLAIVLQTRQSAGALLTAAVCACMLILLALI